ncbi:MAG: alpha/beta fold hydrolase, partial [Chloroflexaceae bacterium]
MNAAPTTSQALPHERRGAGPPLLLLHGAMVDREYWREQIPVFATRHEVVACDLPGHGAAPPLAGPTSIADLAREVLATLDALDLPAVRVLGHSLGGMVAQELALMVPER